MQWRWWKGSAGVFVIGGGGGGGGGDDDDVRAAPECTATAEDLEQDFDVRRIEARASDVRSTRFERPRQNLIEEPAGQHKAPQNRDIQPYLQWLHLR